MDREPRLPLLLSATLAVMLHAVAFTLPPWISHVPPEAPEASPQAPSEPPVPPEVPKAPDPPEPSPPVEPPPKPPAPPEIPEPPEIPAPPELPEPPAPPQPPEPPAELEQDDDEPLLPTEVQLGSDDGKDPLAMAWIAYDDFQELLARHHRTVQPALQQQVDPTPGAPLEVDAARAGEAAAQDQPAMTATSPATQVTQNPQDQYQDAPGAEPVAQSVVESQLALADTASADPSTDTPAEAAPQDAEPSPVPSEIRESLALLPPQPRLREDDRPWALPLPEAVPLPEDPVVPRRREDGPSDDAPADTVPADEAPTPDAPVKAESSGPAEASPAAPSAESASAKTPPSRDASDAPESPSQADKPKIAGDGKEDKPTSAPRSDREADASGADRPMPDHVQAGRVLTGPGIEIQTVRPRFHIATMYTARPRNPRVRVVFDRTGQVIRAELTRSSGYVDIDAPILNSLYRWKARGRRFQEMSSDTFELNLQLLLTD